MAEDKDEEKAMEVVIKKLASIEESDANTHDNEEATEVAIAMADAYPSLNLNNLVLVPWDCTATSHKVVEVEPVYLP